MTKSNTYVFGDFIESVKDIDQAFMITDNKVSTEVFNHLALLQRLDYNIKFNF